MIPMATLTNLNDEDPQNSMILGEFPDLVARVEPSGERSEFLRIHICQLDQFHLAADRAVDARGLSMPLGGPEQVWIGITGVGIEPTGAQYVEDGRLARQRMVDDLSGKSRIGNRLVHRRPIGRT